MKKFRYFGGFLKLQEKWLNEMAKKGWRLNKIQGHSYEFIRCKPEEFAYCVDCILNRKSKDTKEYIDFLHEIGYKTFQTGINLNMSIGKMKWRIGGNKLGHFDTGFGKYNKEILVVEKKKDENPFRLHTSKKDIINYYISLRNIYLPVLLLCTIMLMDRYYFHIVFHSFHIGISVILFSLIMLFLIPVFICQVRINGINKE